MPSRTRSRLLPGLFGVALASTVALGSTGASGAVRAAAAAPGLTAQQVADNALISRYVASGASAEDESGRTLYVAQAVNGSKTGAVGTVIPEAYAAGVAEAAALDAQASVTGKTWQQIGRTSLNSVGDGYGQVNQLGIPTDSGRVEDIAYDPALQGHWFVSVANGGVWETKDAGSTWASVGEGLPTQITGTVAYDAGRLIVGTGDPAFGGSSIAGLGAYWTDDDGVTWHHASGVPSGSLSFQLRVDPTNPAVVYLATSMGLWRSADKGASYTDVALPTTCTSATDLNCYFANIVTDVVVRSADADGTGGGKVLAAVGWRNGQKLNANGKPQAPQNGLYASDTGAPGSFTFLDPGTVTNQVSTTGLPATVNIGRTTLAVASGAGQDKDYVYAVIQDAGKMNATAGAFDTPQTGVTSTAAGTVLNGIYGSSDFGQTWTMLANAESLKSPTGQSALVGAGTTSYAPGIQAWYNSYIVVDPTTQDALGAPDHLVFGLEEIWQNTLADGTLSPIVISPAGSATQASVGTTQFQTVGRYYGGDSCYGLNATLPVPCTTNVQNTGSTTTHPDQHAAAFVPDGTGGYTLVVGDDGGVFAQTVAAGGVPTQGAWGQGANGQPGANLQTFLPYDVSMSKDGSVVSGLQDNGEMLVTPDGQAYQTYGGDGFYSQIDPVDSQTYYEEYTYGALAVTTTGGKAATLTEQLQAGFNGPTWTSLDTGLTATTALFATPFMMDPDDSKHLVVGGRPIIETLSGPATTAEGSGDETDFKTVFDLGTRLHPGDATATAVTGQADPSLNSPNNITSAIDISGSNVYVGYCGYCDILTGGLPFQSGIATNVGGAKENNEYTSDGWHIASAIGLPQRYVTGIRQDPTDPTTVYATLGGYGRRWIAPGGLGDDTSRVGAGHLFVSTDSGEHFKDISGNLPDVPAYDVIVHNGYVVVGTDVGVYATPVTAPGTYAPYAAGMPKAPVVRLAYSPRNGDELLAANYGRGDYLLPATAGVVTPPVITGGTPAAPPTTASGGSSGGSGSLASTGLDAGLPAVAVVLVAGGAVLRRRRRLQHGG